MRPVYYRVAAAEDAGPAYPQGDLKVAHQEDGDPDFTHWIDWADGYFVVWPDCAGRIEVADQAIAFPLERA